MSAPFCLLACSGATDTGLFDGTTTESSPTDPAPSTANGVDASPTSMPPAPTPTPDAGPDADPPPSGCTREIEPNNTNDRATPFSGSFCGQLSSKDDIDFAEFAVPQNAKNLAITHSEEEGKVAYRYYLNGTLLPVSAEIPATPGAVYSVSIRLAAGSKGSTPSYKLNVAFTYQ